MDILSACNFSSAPCQVLKRTKDILLIRSFYEMSRHKFGMTYNKKLGCLLLIINSRCIQKDHVCSIKFAALIYICSRVDKAMTLPEFGEQAGHLLIMNKILYRLHYLGQRFNKHLRRYLHNLGFRQTDCETNIWIWDARNVYEYIVIYGNDLCLSIKEPLKLLTAFKANGWYQLKEK